MPKQSPDSVWTIWGDLPTFFTGSLSTGSVSTGSGLIIVRAMSGSDGNENSTLSRGRSSSRIPRSPALKIPRTTLVITADRVYTTAVGGKKAGPVGYFNSCYGRGEPIAVTSVFFSQSEALARVAVWPYMCLPSQIFRRFNRHVNRLRMCLLRLRRTSLEWRYRATRLSVPKKENTPSENGGSLPAVAQLVVSYEHPGGPDACYDRGAVARLGCFFFVNGGGSP